MRAYEGFACNTTSTDPQEILKIGALDRATGVCRHLAAQGAIFTVKWIVAWVWQAKWSKQSVDTNLHPPAPKDPASFILLWRNGYPNGQRCCESRSGENPGKPFRSLQTLSAHPSHLRTPLLQEQLPASTLICHNLQCTQLGGVASRSHQSLSRGSQTVLNTNDKSQRTACGPSLALRKSQATKRLCPCGCCLYCTVPTSSLGWLWREKM